MPANRLSADPSTESPRGRGADQPEQSYSERQIYEAALGRLARELAAVEDIDERSAMDKLEQLVAA